MGNQADRPKCFLGMASCRDARFHCLWHKHSSINSIKFEMDAKVSYKDGRLYVNDSVSFAQEDLEKAIQEKEQLGVESPIGDRRRRGF